MGRNVSSLLICQSYAKLRMNSNNLFMRDDEKIENDLRKMREAYQKAMQSFDEIEKRQKKIAEMIYNREKE